MFTHLLVAVILDCAVGHGLVGYIQKDGSSEICTMRSTMGNADGNYGPLTVSASTADACGQPPGTPKKVLAYSGDGRDLRETQAGSGPYWINPQETDATCSFKAGDKVNAFVYISGNHGGSATWEHRALSSGEGKISNGDFQQIPNAKWDYSPSGPPETSQALGPHVESFTIPSDLQAGWQTLRWNWVAPGPVQFVHCVDVTIDAAVESPTTTDPAAATTSVSPSSGALPEFGDWAAECEGRPCAHVAMLPGSQVLISMRGPADVWFGIGFDAVQMLDAPYAIIVSGDGAVSERKLALHSAGNELQSQVSLLDESVADGTRTVVLKRAAAGISTEHYTFTGESTNYIWAFGLQSNFGFHAENWGRWAACEPIGACNPTWCNVNEAFSWCASQSAASCDALWCQASDASLSLPHAAPPTLPTRTTTAVPSIPGFVAVDGGSNRACRGSSSLDNLASYYTVVPGSVPSLEACKAECLSVTDCVGIEHNPSSGRCEVWTRIAGIGATAFVRGYHCWSYGTNPPGIGGFINVDGGSNRACRGGSSSDNSASYYTVVPMSVSSLEACKSECMSVTGCVGIEHNPSSGRCEVWTRPAGIGATASVQGYKCLRYQSGSLLAVKRHTFRGSVLLQDLVQVAHLQHFIGGRDELHTVASHASEEC